MPIYVCSAATGRLTPVQKTKIARSLTDIYHQVTGAPRYFVHVIFHDVPPGNIYVAGRPAPADEILIRGDTRSGKTNEQRSQMVRRIIQDVARASGAAEDAVTFLLCEIPAENTALNPLEYNIGNSGRELRQVWPRPAAPRAAPNINTGLRDNSSFASTQSVAVTRLWTDCLASAQGHPLRRSITKGS
jgi:phenylpyruvate tautomerase PptA (4-oxalocrotonate tautomerase family)